MFICKVVGKVVSTIKHPRLGAGSLILVRRLYTDGFDDRELLVASDSFGCGEGDTILVTQGSNARFAQAAEYAPLDLSVVGIVDSYQLATEQSAPAAAPAKPKPGAKPAARKPRTKTNK